MLTYVAVDARTGSVLAYLPGLVMQSPLAVTIGRYESNTATIPLPAGVVAAAQQPPGNVPAAAVEQLADFNLATREGGAVIVALDETNQPVWGGMVVKNTTGASSSQPATSVSITVDLVTAEAYFDRRFTGAYQVANRRSDLIVADLIAANIVDGAGGLPGIQIRVANTASAFTFSETYNDYDDRTVYSNLTTLSGLTNGPQWTVGWEWASPTSAGVQRITPVLYVADRLGTPAPSGLRPAAQFSLPGNVVEAQRVRDWTSGNGANLVTATGTGVGLARAQSQGFTDTVGRPTYEYRYAPSTDSNNVETLSQHQERVLAALAPGTVSVAITGLIDVAPVLGVDWNLGDDVGFDLWGPAWIDGSMLAQVGTVGGWQRTDTSISPILVTPNLGSL